MRSLYHDSTTVPIASTTAKTINRSTATCKDPSQRDMRTITTSNQKRSSGRVGGAVCVRGTPWGLCAAVPLPLLVLASAVGAAAGAVGGWEIRFLRLMYAMS